MSLSIEVPSLGESITEAIIARWLKQEGETVATDEPIVELETDKITVEVPAPRAGVLTKHLAPEGETVNVGDAIAELEEGEGAPATAPSAPTAAPTTAPATAHATSPTAPAVMPAARAEAARQGVDPATVQGTGRGGRVLKEDVQRASSPGTPATTPVSSAKPAPAPAPAATRPVAPREPGEREERVRMSSLRRRIAERLLASQHEAAILTTFNEVDMSAVIATRKTLQEPFVAKHGIKLGFMSFFVKAAVEALKAFPSVNAEIDGEEVIYKHYYDIGVAVGGGKGLVVPIIRSADELGFADVEKEIARLAGLAKTNKLQISDLTGGTFTVSNGGIYGSMLSTPILNPPQTGILGLHNIVQRPVALGGEVVIRPVMYLALSYDHRLVDGREAVQFLIAIKSAIEDPRRLMLEI